MKNEMNKIKKRDKIIQRSREIMKKKKIKYINKRYEQKRIKLKWIRETK